jgi:hypothetical protein
MILKNGLTAETMQGRPMSLYDYRLLHRFRGLKFETMFIQLWWLQRRKESRGLRPNFHVAVIAWSWKWMDLKEIHYVKSISDKFNVNILMYSIALFVYYPYFIILYASLKSFDFQNISIDILGLIYLV